MSTQEKTAKKATKRSENGQEKSKFDHEKDNVWEAVGISREREEVLIDEMNGSMKGVRKCSQAVERLEENFSKTELAYVLVMTQVDRLKSDERDELMSHLVKAVLRR